MEIGSKRAFLAFQHLKKDLNNVFFHFMAHFANFASSFYRVC